MDIIECKSMPSIRAGCGIAEHRSVEKIFWNAKRQANSLYLSEAQQQDSSIDGHLLRRELSELEVLNATVLDYLLVHQDIVPERWKDLCIFFWGTVFLDTKGQEYVSCLWYDHLGTRRSIGKNSWIRRQNYLHAKFWLGDPAALLAR